MGTYRTKPVTKEAVQLTWANWNEVCNFAGVGKLSEGKPQGCYLDAEGKLLPEGVTSDRIGLVIPTLEGVMIAAQDDWIIRGLRSELYSCKPDIFEKTYEAVI